MGRPGRRCCCGAAEGYNNPPHASCRVGYTGPQGPVPYSGSTWGTLYNAVDNFPAGNFTDDGSGAPAAPPFSTIINTSGPGEQYGVTHNTNYPNPPVVPTNPTYGNHRPRNATISSNSIVMAPGAPDWANPLYFNHQANDMPPRYTEEVGIGRSWQIPATHNPKRVVFRYGAASIASDIPREDAPNIGPTATFRVGGVPMQIDSFALFPEAYPDITIEYDRQGDHTSNTYTRTHSINGVGTVNNPLDCIMSTGVSLIVTRHPGLFFNGTYFGPDPTSNDATITGTWGKMEVEIGDGTESDIDVGFNGWTADPGAGWTKNGTQWDYTNGAATTTIHPLGIRKTYNGLTTNGLYRIAVDGKCYVDINGANATTTAGPPSVPQGFTFRAQAGDNIVRILGNAGDTNSVTNYKLSLINE